MLRKTFLAVAAVAAFAVITSPAVAAKGGNSSAAKACQKGGWESLSPSTDAGAGFASAEECTGYAAQGGSLVSLQTAAYPAAKTACEDAGYAYNEPGGTLFGDPLHFTCGSTGDGLTVQQAWDGPATAPNGTCASAANAWTTIITDEWLTGNIVFPATGWYAACYGTLPS